MRRARPIRRCWVAALFGAALYLGLLPAAARATTTPSVLNGAYSSFPDYLDPQLSYTAEGWTAMYDVYVPLLTYRHGAGKAGSEVIPGLAQALPKVTDGGKTYTLFLRPGMRYSDGTPVRASDFRYAVERMFTLHSGGSAFYEDIVGSGAYAEGRRAHISGITADDLSGKIVIHLTTPRATFSNELALPFVAPVPADTPMRDRSFNPPPATGPYAITSANLRGWRYERNPQWQTDGALMPEIPAGHVDRIKVSVVRNGETQVDELESGKLDWLFDPPSLDRIGEIEAGRGGTQIRLEPTLSTYYFWLNTTEAPFNSLKVRRAVNYAVDPAVLSRLYAGQTRPTDQILPPGMPGYRKFDLYPHNMTKARGLIREADPRDRTITVWTDSESPNDLAGVYLQVVLQKLGFRVSLKILSPDNYFTKIGNGRTPHLDAGFADWFEDYAHPNDFLQPLLAEVPTRFYTNNFARLMAPKLNQKVAALDRDSGPIDEAAYARLDRDYMKLAPIVPFGTRTLAASFSRSVDLRGFVWNPTFETDLTSLRLK